MSANPTRRWANGDAENSKVLDVLFSGYEIFHKDSHLRRVTRQPDALGPHTDGIPHEPWKRRVTRAHRATYGA